MDGGGPTRDPRTIGDLVGQLSSDVADLVRKETDLLRAEVEETLKRARRGAKEIAAGWALMLAGLILFLVAVVIALANVIGPVWASLVVGVVVAGAGFTLTKVGERALRPDALKPERWNRQVQRDAELVKGGRR